MSRTMASANLTGWVRRSPVGLSRSQPAGAGSSAMRSLRLTGSTGLTFPSPPAAELIPASRSPSPLATPSSPFCSCSALFRNASACCSSFDLPHARQITGASASTATTTIGLMEAPIYYDFASGSISPFLLPQDVELRRIGDSHHGHDPGLDGVRHDEVRRV